MVARNNIACAGFWGGESLPQQKKQLQMQTAGVLQVRTEETRLAGVSGRKLEMSASIYTDTFQGVKLPSIKSPGQ